MNIERVTYNLAHQHLRRERLHGREYMVVPMTMLTEGVHRGSYGPLYYPASELSHSPAVWNLKPVVVYHPAQGTATDPNELASRQVGIIMNTRWQNGRLIAEAWLEPDRLATVAPDVLAAIQAGRTVEVSTGLFTDNSPSPGVWDGEPYKFVARNYRPDHLAILPTGVGACSVADGCGLLQLNKENEMTQNGMNAGQSLLRNEVSLGYLEGAAEAMRSDGYTAEAAALQQYVDNARGPADEAPLGLPPASYNPAPAKPCCGDETAAGTHTRNNTHQQAHVPKDAPLGLPKWEF